MQTVPPESFLLYPFLVSNIDKSGLVQKTRLIMQVTIQA